MKKLPNQKPRLAYGWAPDLPDNRDHQYAAPMAKLRALRLKPIFATFVPLFTTRDKSVLAPPTRLPQPSNSIAKSKSSPTSSHHGSSFTTTSGAWNTACHSTAARKFATALRVLATKALAQKKNGLTTTLRLTRPRTSGWPELNRRKHHRSPATRTQRNSSPLTTSVSFAAWRR